MLKLTYHNMSEMYQADKCKPSATVDPPKRPHVEDCGQGMIVEEPEEQGQTYDGVGDGDGDGEDTG